MRRLPCALLLGVAALSLLAAVLATSISMLFLTKPDVEFAEAGRAGLAISATLVAFGSPALLMAVAVSPPSDRTEVWRSFLRWLVVAALMVIPTAALFGPSGGFHHHIGFGFPMFYMVWNGEDPAPGSFQIVTGYEVWFIAWRFGMLLAIWVVLLFGAIALVRPSRMLKVSTAIPANCA